MILTCAKIQKKILIFGEVGSPKSSFGGYKNYMNIIRPMHFVNIRFILNNPRYYLK